MSIDVDEFLRDVRPDDARRVDAVFPADVRAEMLEAIVGDHPRRRRVRRSRAYSLAALVVAAAVATTVLVSTGGSGLHVAPEPAAAAEGVRFEAGTKGDIIAYVTDPYAASRNLSAAFSQRGFDITLSMLPVSPSLVGTVVYIGSDLGNENLIRTLSGGSCATGGGSCPIGLDISGRFRGAAQVTLGRPARLGERYASSTSAFGPGEPLHCTGLLDATVGRLRAVLATKHLNAEWRDSDAQNAIVAEPLASDHVQGVEMAASSLVTVSVSRSPIDPVFHAGDVAHWNAYLAQLNAGCPK